MRRELSLAVILCEDLQQQCFVYRYLRHRGLSHHRIRVRKAPAAKGAAEQWVRQQYPTEVAALRARRHSSPGLVTIIDADDLSHQQRISQLAEALRHAGQPPRETDEPIALLIPKRNIETWMHHLLGQAVNEDDVYPKFPAEQRTCEPAVREFARRCPNDMGSAPPSLQAACAELTRFLGMDS